MVELDEAMKEIQASINEFTEQPTAAEGSDDESDSEDEEEGGRSLNFSCIHLVVICIAHSIGDVTYALFFLQMS